MGLLDQQYSNMSWEELYNLRNKYGRTDPMQNVLAPYEHRAYSREQVEANPVRGAIGQAVLVPGYTIAKSIPPLARLVGADKARSDPSFEEIKQAYIGIGEGLLGRGKRNAR